MQFLIKCEVNLEIGGDKAPLLCDVRLGAAFDDQPTACLLGRSEPVQCIESESSCKEKSPQIYRGKHKLFS